MSLQGERLFGVAIGVKFRGRFAEWERPEDNNKKLGILTRESSDEPWGPGWLGKGLNRKKLRGRY